ncbi:EamA family transporter RarD [Celeribacter litoreus]|uniref:EamA family transporter RarD n=1 Tax=Celeribacter litoreus TaxID=2876714 RepID=UPI001CCD9AEA|nr:EamA family transporter RarD [Celeribacter litoreus]MCA0043752.1 EamA family transporter RarD [Celeribacter litoreus]
MTETQKGFIALFIAQSSWGLAPFYYKAAAHVPAFEILAHRTLWTFLLFGGWILFQGRSGELKWLLSGRNLRQLIPTACLVSVNWGLFIYAVQSGHTLDASLGYYILPLVSTAIGIIVFRERLRLLQYVALAIATLAVAILGVGLGALPWIPLAMAMSFSIYSALKKTLDAGPVISVTAEVAVLTPIALLYLLGVEIWGWGTLEGQPGGVFGRTFLDSVLLISSGLVTGVPLIFFAAAARRLPLSIVGMGQYWNSSIQFALAVFVFVEPFTRWHAIAMPMIWLALVLYSVEVFRQDRQSRRVANSVASS